MRGWRLIETPLVLLVADAIGWVVVAPGGQARTKPVGGLPNWLARGIVLGCLTAAQSASARRQQAWTC